MHSSLYKNAIKYVSSALLAVILLMATGNLFAEGNGASVSDVSGYVTVTNKDGDVKRLKAGDSLKDGEVVNTGNDSGISILLASGETLTLGAQSSYTVGGSVGSGDKFAHRSLGGNAPTLSTSTTAGGTIGGVDGVDAPTTPGDGGSPTN